MLLQVFKGDQATWAVIIFTVGLTLNGAVTAGYLGNALDIAPNFSGDFELHILYIREIFITTWNPRVK